MQTAKVKYIAPPGDARVAEMGGVTFFDGQPVDINDVDHKHLFGKLRTNPRFVFDNGAEQDAAPKRRGRPPGRQQVQEAGDDTASGSDAEQDDIPSVQPVP